MSLIEEINSISFNSIEQSKAEQMLEPTSDFIQIVRMGVGNLSENIVDADVALQDLALDKPISTHEVMLTLEKAKLSMSIAVEVRNKLVEGYQEMMRMQI